MKTLPDKASDLLDLAVTDAIAVSRLKSVRLDMGRWLAKERLESGPRRGRTVCVMCMAGATMYRTLGQRPAGSKVFPRNVADDNATQSKLHTINAMRTGYFGSHWGETRAQNAARRAASTLVQSNYNIDTGRAPWRVYRKAAKILREAGL